MRVNLRTQKGVGLLEVLIAALIIGIGLLGVASMQVKALQASTNAEMRARATDLAWALADRIRTNIMVNEDYITQVVLSNCPVANNVPTCTMIPGDAPIVANNCTPADIAVEDLEEIFCAEGSGVHEVLAGGTLEVTCTDVEPGDTDPCSPGSEMAITIGWSVRDDLFGTGTDELIMSFIPEPPAVAP